MAKFNIGDKVTSVWEPNKIGVIESINTLFYSSPLYTVCYEDGNKYANYEETFKKVVTPDDALRYGDILTDDELYCNILGAGWFSDYGYIRIRTILYDERIFYHKMVDGEVEKFKELTA